MNNYLLIFIIALFTLMGSFGSYCFKKAAGAGGVVDIIKSPILYIGGILYGISLILNIYTLNYMPYSVVFPLTSVTYIWSLAIGKALLNEKITSKKMIGIGFIVLGVLCMVM